MNHIDTLIQRYIDQTASDEERAELMHLIRSGTIEAAVKERIAEALKTEMRIGQAPGPGMQPKADELFKQILAEREAIGKKEVAMMPDAAQAQHPTTRLRYIHVMRYAAAVILLAVAGLFIYQYTVVPDDTAFLKTPSAGFVKAANTGTLTRIITLQDGSTIALAPGSEVHYAETFDSLREVYLSGDAFFEVTKDPARPFLVYTHEVTTRVLGTSFRVKANRNEKEIVVAVKTGKVSVRAEAEINRPGKQQEVTLTPNQQAVYKRQEHTVVKQLVERPQVIKGRVSTRSYYVNAGVVSILNSLSERYGVHIHYDKETLAACTITSDMIEGEGLFEQLEIVCNALGGAYSVQDDASIVIEANGCLSE